MRRVVCDATVFLLTICLLDCQRRPSLYKQSRLPFSDCGEFDPELDQAYVDFHVDTQSSFDCWRRPQTTWNESSGHTIEYCPSSSQQIARGTSRGDRPFARPSCLSSPGPLFTTMPLQIAHPSNRHPYTPATRPLFTTTPLHVARLGRSSTLGEENVRLCWLRFSRDESSFCLYSLLGACVGMLHLGVLRGCDCDAFSDSLPLQALTLFE